MPTTKLVILGRDGILNEYREGHVTEPAQWLPVPGALQAVARLNHAGWHVVVATNQAGIGRGMIDMATINAVHVHMNQLLQAQGGRLDAVFFCPHTPEDNCQCRKPRPGMMQDIGLRYGVDLAHISMVADTLRDLQAAQAAGCKPHLVKSGRAAALNTEQLDAWLSSVPGTQVHTTLDDFVDSLLGQGAGASVLATAAAT
jgi:D-glycero-D-manno-heptose 1,7-bisphosphate phosphatase